ncbi:MAG: 3-phosphoserine/phosphohydroxythreonine transaminase [Acidiferrobacterales bacterium]|nr:3-phosphoserine/phosphohydroxythreonine transaminase [Acidiferrobacterales bacterium]
MSRAFNFGAGPAMLPEEVLAQVRDELIDLHGSGMSVMEMSHRGKDFLGIAQQAEADLRELLAIPAGYKVLFLQGGAQGQFAAVPLNLLGGKAGADYVNTGHWSKRAIAEAGHYCKVNVVASSEATRFSTVPPQSEWTLHPDAAYVHYTPNETIGGVEFHWVPETGEVPLVADMSSTILSRPIDVSCFGIIYAGAQKNVGPAGVTVVIVREELLDRARGDVPSILNYRLQADQGSMFNTPCTFGWYVAGLVFDWLKRKGGLAAMGEINKRKADKLYACIDNSGGFYSNPVDRACRSWMNVPFSLVDGGLDEVFLKETHAAGLLQLKGHRSVGGMRASIYNAMPEEGVDTLIQFMQQFAQKHG